MTREEQYSSSKPPSCVVFVIPKLFPFHIFLAVKSAIYYVAIATAIFSRVKITCFRVEAHMVFQWCLYNRERLEKGLTGASYTTHMTKRDKKAMW